MAESPIQGSTHSGSSLSLSTKGPLRSKRCDTLLERLDLHSLKIKQPKKQTTKPTPTKRQKQHNKKKEHTGSYQSRHQQAKTFIQVHDQ